VGGWGGGGGLVGIFYYIKDNGSTAVEVALKMALRKYMHDHQLLALSDDALHAMEFR
jgi:hypothetical protein